MGNENESRFVVQYCRQGERGANLSKIETVDYIQTIENLKKDFTKEDNIYVIVRDLRSHNLIYDGRLYQSNFYSSVDFDKVSFDKQFDQIFGQ